jgi:hypothetical protein
MLATRGVLQGGAEYVAEETLGLGSTGRRSTSLQHDQSHPHSHPPATKPRSAIKRRRSGR